MKRVGYDFPVRENDFREEDFHILTVFGNIKYSIWIRIFRKICRW